MELTLLKKECAVSITVRYVMLDTLWFRLWHRLRVVMYSAALNGGCGVIINAVSQSQPRHQRLNEAAQHSSCLLREPVFLLELIAKWRTLSRSVVYYQD